MSYSKQKQIQTDLNDIREVGDFIFELHCRISNLEEIIRSDDCDMRLQKKNEWLEILGRPFAIRRRDEEAIYEIYSKLDGMFDYSNFPLYANTIFNPENMFHFFGEKRDEKICKVKRTITKLLNSNDKEFVEHYKEIAFMGQEGIGQSHMSIKWHRKLAEWLEQVIQSDPVIDDYVKGDPDPYYPGSSVRVSELNLVEFISDADKIYPEDV